MFSYPQQNPLEEAFHSLDTVCQLKFYIRDSREVQEDRDQLFICYGQWKEYLAVAKKTLYNYC